MSYDAITTAAAAAEVRERLDRGRVDKVIQPSDLAVALFVRARGANHTLLLSAHPQHARVTLTAARLAKAYDEPSPFVMLLRKYLEGTSLTDVRQVGHDRILRLTFRAGPNSTTLVAEVMGKHSNIILVDEQDVILGAVKRITPAQSRYRVVLPHQPYLLPPAQTQPSPPAPREDLPKLDSMTLDPDGLAAALASWPDDKPLAGALLDVLAGASPQLTREAAYRLCGTTDATLGTGRARLGEALDLARTLMAPSRWSPSLARRDGRALGWAAYPLLQHGVEPTLYPSLEALLDDVYGESPIESDDALGSQRAALRDSVSAARTRLSRKVASLRQGLKAPEEIDLLRRQGEMVLAFAHDIAPDARELRLDDPPMTVPLDPTLTPSENARALFARYRKLRDAAARVPAMLEDAEGELEFLDAMLLFVEQADAPQGLKEVRDDLTAAGFAPSGSGGKAGGGKAGGGKAGGGKAGGGKAGGAQGKGAGAKDKGGKDKGAKTKGGKYHPGGKEAPKKATAALRFTTGDGLQVLVGRSARQNEVVTFDLASSGDMWFHARGMPGSHVVLKTAGRTPPARSIEQAAALAAYYSRGRGSTTVPVDVAPARNVRRVKGGKPGLVHISGEATVNVHPRAQPE